MSTVSVASVGMEEDRVKYAFAMEYNGPPLSYDIPRAVPITVERIPVASIVTQIPFQDNVTFPVIQPVISSGNLANNFTKEVNKAGSDTNVSPTLVIDFEKIEGGCELEKIVVKPSDTTLLSASISVFEERTKNDECCDEVGELGSSGALLEGFTGGCESGDWSGLINSSSELGSSSISHDHSTDLVGGGGNSCPSEFYQGIEKSQDLLATLEASTSSRSCQDNLDPSDTNGPEWGSSKSVTSFNYPSSIVSSFRTGECNSMHHDDVNRSAVGFRYLDSYDGTDEELTYAVAERLRPKKEPVVKSRKGTCYRCLKGNRFTEKEICIVCSAKYCSNCVLRAMGSMPEGRKCVTCIGYAIDESKRGNLGKCSKMLKRLLNGLEIQQIMKSEKMCDANQLPPECICINGKPLCYEELLILQTCSNPPKNLKPGSYWYDRVSGLWGKEGEKPSHIVSPHLNVGESIKPDASNGNTQVFINGREITKPELRMLQLAGVQCAGNPHFWVNDDGSYQEEGQKQTKGYLWDKAGMKVICALLSLPFPLKQKHPCTEEKVDVLNRSIPDYLGERTPQKLLLVGYSGAGTSTIFKQAKILYKTTPFSDDERERIKLMIQGNVYGYIGLLLEGRERFEEEILADPLTDKSADSEGNECGNDDMTMYSISPRLKEFCDWFLKTMASGSLETVFPAATREYAPLVEELWNTAAIQATYSRRSELEILPTVASHFLQRAADVLQPDYEPSDLDILYAEGLNSPNGLASMEFSFPPSTDDDFETSEQERYELIRVQAKGFAENWKWLEMLEDVRLVIFCVSLTDYDQFSIDNDGASVNKLLRSKQLFESIVTHPTFEHKDFLLVLNKFDIFEEKIEQVPLPECEWFQNFQPVISEQNNVKNSRTRSINYNPSLGQLGAHYIGLKFKRLYYDLTGQKLFVSPVKGLEPYSVDSALKYGREILKWGDERINFSSSEYSTYCTEASFSSQ